MPDTNAVDNVHSVQVLIRRMHALTPHGLNVNRYTRDIKVDNPAQNLFYDPPSSL